MRIAKKITKRQRSIFLDILGHTGNVSAATRAANISRKMAYSLKLSDPAFAEEWQLALEDAMDDLEAALRNRAINGVEKPIYYAGKECGRQRNYSDTVGMYILKKNTDAQTLNKTELSVESQESTPPRDQLIGRLEDIIERLQQGQVEP